MNTTIRKSVVVRVASSCLTIISICCFSASALAVETIYSEDFEGDDGGFVATLFDPLGAAAENDWTWGETGVDGSNAWTAVGAAVGTPFEQHLDVPSITVPNSGLVLLEFDHSYGFEATWDGGVVMFGVNGGDLSYVTPDSFAVNGYNDLMQSNADWGYDDDMNGLEMFGVDSGGFIRSTAKLGTLNAGDTLEIQFRGGWDWGTQVPAGWTIDNISVTQVDVLGDFDENGSVEFGDFLVLANNFGTGSTYAEGDINFSGSVDLGDFAEFRQLFLSLPAGEAAAVPEPSAAVLLQLALLLGFVARRKSR